MDFSRRSRAANSAVGDRIWLSFEIIQDFVAVLIACKNEKDPIINECAKVATRFPHYNSTSGWMHRRMDAGSVVIL